MTTANTVDQLTRIRYVGQDFQTYVNESTEFLRTYYSDEYNDWIESNMGIALIQLLGYTSQGLAFYMNRRTTDLYHTTAQSPNAISKFARMLNYTIEAASSAAVDIVVTLTSSYSYPITIAKGFRFNGPNGLLFEYRNDEDIIFVPGETQKTFTVYEGETKEVAFVSDGKENQKFLLQGVPAGQLLVGASLEVYVQNELWIEKNQIPYAVGNFYEVDYVSQPPVVSFGDGIVGTIPENGNEIRIRYSYCNGKQGRIGSGLIESAFDPLVVRNQKVDLTVTNLRPSSGGEDHEDLRKVKSLAPEFFQSQDRAISIRDYNAIANTYPGIAKANTQVVRGVEDDYTINFYCDRIINNVTTGVSGIIVESEPLLTQINNDMTAIVSGIDTFESNLLSDINPLLVNISDNLTNMQSSVSGVVAGFVGSLVSDFVAVNADLDSIESVISDMIPQYDGDIVIHQAIISSLISQINDSVSGCGSGVQSQVANFGIAIDSEVANIRISIGTLSSNVNSTVSGLLTSIRNRLSSVQTNAENLYTNIESVMLPYFVLIRSDLAAVSGSVSYHSDDLIASVSGSVLDIEEQVSGIQEIFDQHSADVIDLVSADIDSLKTYLDESISTSCTANIVEVQILQVDSNNNYIAPTEQIKEELRVHLQARADAVHVVRVLDGSVDIVYVDVEIGIKVAAEAIEQDVHDRAVASLTKADDQPYGLLVLRDYGQNLYRYEISKAIRDIQVRDTDIEYANIDITYPTSKLDAKGNLIIAGKEVIVPRNITVTVL